VCFSATANFVGSGVLATIGVATLREVQAPEGGNCLRHSRAYLRCTSSRGIVWLGLDHKLGPTVAHAAERAYVLYR